MKKSHLFNIALINAIASGNFINYSSGSGVMARPLPSNETPQHIQDAIIAKAKVKRERKAKKRLFDAAFTKRYAHQ